MRSPIKAYPSPKDYSEQAGPEDDVSFKPGTTATSYRRRNERTARLIAWRALGSRKPC